MNTVKQLTQDIKEIKELLKTLFNYSNIKRRNFHGNGFTIIHLRGDHYWKELPKEGKKIQSRLFKDYNHFVELARLLLSDEPQEYQSKFEKNKNIILSIIEQSEPLWDKTIKEAHKRAVKSLDEQIEILSNLYDSSSDKIIYVPDTSALLTNPDIDLWRFKETPKFDIILLPTVLSELDDLKIYHKVENIRKRAERIIRRIKGFRVRGKLTEGVVLAKGVSNLISIAVEPNFNRSLSWLDPNNNDDRILAAFLEVLKKFPKSEVILVTRDINLQNKAEFARVNFVEPPEKTTNE